jgi:hypothetical protein
MRLRSLMAAAVLSLTVATAAAGPAHATGTPSAAAFSAAVAQISALPYQPAYVPAGLDAAFPSGTVPNQPALADYTTSSIANSGSSPNASYDPTGVAGAPPWPAGFTSVSISLPNDGAGAAKGAIKLWGWAGLHPGNHPAVLVVHGFNTHGAWSVIRWAAMLYANGWNVAAFDQRDFSDQTDFDHPQTFGWKESQDVLAAGRWLKQQPGVTDLGVVGFSEGAQNTVLAMAQDTTHVFSAGFTFSGPADQNQQVFTTAVPGGCVSGCQYPATDALVSLVVPSPSGVPYTDACAVLSDAATAYGTTAFDIFTHESAMHAQQSITVPLLNIYSADDQLVNPLMAGLMASYEQGNPLQKTLLVDQGMHAYFYDRNWQQQAILDYFKSLLATSDGSVTTTPTVNQTPNGAAFSSHLQSITTPTPAAADASLAPFVCDASKQAPGRPPTAAAQPSPTASANSGSNSTPSAAASTLPNTSAATGDATPALAAIAVLGALATLRRACGSPRRGGRRGRGRA